MDAPVDLDFARKLPKIELHAHLSGSISRSSLYKLWLEKKQAQPHLDLIDPNVALPDDEGVDINSFFGLFSRYIYKLIDDEDSIRKSTLQVLADFEADGVHYLELRTTPREITSASISRRRYVEIVLDAMEEYRSDKSHNMWCTLILCIDRRDNLEKAEETTEIALDLQSRGIVAMDLCGDPLRVPIDHLMECFVKAKMGGLKMTLHFAEHQKSATDEELLQLLSVGPQRLGHVIHVSPKFDELIRKDTIGLELCLSCNVKAKMIDGSFADHHLGKWLREGYQRIALCTDDVGIFGSPLSNEYYLAAKHFNLSRSQLIDLAKYPVDLVFRSPSAGMQLGTNIMHDWFSKFRAEH